MASKTKKNEDDQDNTEAEDKKDVEEEDSDDSPVAIGPADEEEGVGAAQSTKTCDLDFEKDVWKVTSKDITNSTSVAVYEWKEDTLHQYVETETPFDSQEECEAILSYMSNTTDASCKDGKLINKLDLGTFDNYSSEKRKELFDKIKADQCSE